jgi:hypothetical protein
MKYVKIILLALLGVFAIMQLINRPKKNRSEGPQPNHISKIAAVPDPVANILQKACNDCHSNNTIYPWYAEVMPVGWIVNNHIVHGKDELNLDEFTTYKPKKQWHKLEEVAEQVEHDAMPISSYTRMHKSARLSKEEKELLIKWAQDTRTQLMQKYLADSLQNSAAKTAP